MNERAKAMQFPAGKSGNPGGAPKGILRRVREKHGEDVDAILDIMARLAKGEKVEGYEDVKSRDRIMAGMHVLDRVIGKPKEHVTLTESTTSATGQAALALAGVSLERRRELLAALDEAAALTEPTGDGSGSIQ